VAAVLAAFLLPVAQGTDDDEHDERRQRRGKIKFLGKRTLADAVRGLSLFRPCLHGVGHPRAARPCDFRRFGTHPGAKGVDGRGADIGGRVAPRRQRFARRQDRSEAGGRDQSADRHRGIIHGMDHGGFKLCRHAGTGPCPRLRGCELRDRAAAREPLVSARASGQGDGTCRYGQFGRCARGALRSRPRQAVRLERRARPRVHPADDCLLRLSRDGEGRPGRARTEEAGSLFRAAQDRRCLVADGLLRSDLRRLRRARGVAADLLHRPVPSDPGDGGLLHRRLRLCRLARATDGRRARRPDRRRQGADDGVRRRGAGDRRRTAGKHAARRARPVRYRDARARHRQWLGIPARAAALFRRNGRAPFHPVSTSSRGSPCWH
jgi:hypothetical protein